MKNELNNTETRIDLVTYFSERLENLKKGLSDDDTLSDYIAIHPILSKMDYFELNTLIVGNWLIQSDAASPVPYKVIEYRDYKDIENQLKIENEKLKKEIEELKRNLK